MCVAEGLRSLVVCCGKEWICVASSRFGKYCRLILYFCVRIAQRVGPLFWLIPAVLVRTYDEHPTSTVGTKSSLSLC